MQSKEPILAFMFLTGNYPHGGKDDYDETRMAEIFWENPYVTRMAAEIFSDLSYMTGERHDDSYDFNVSHSGRKVWSSYYAFLVSTVHLMCNGH